IETRKTEFFVCEDAVLTDSIEKYHMVIFGSSEALYLKYTQSKVLLYALLFSDYKTVIRKLIIRRERFNYSYYLIQYADLNDRNELATFLNGKTTNWNM
ncbi:hypothetical protein PMAYCL1PPCAC_21513, partial [Pristionchus mayeri]